MIVPVTNVTGNDETVSDYKLYEYKGSDNGNKVCFFIRITRLVTKCLCPNSPYFFQPLSPLHNILYQLHEFVKKFIYFLQVSKVL